MRLVVGVDGSEASFHAVALAGRLVSAESDEICLYYSPPAIHVRGGAIKDPKIEQRARAALAGAVFAETRDRLPEALHPRVTELMGRRSPAHGLLVAVDEQRADLVVVGPHGTGRLERLLVGSVTRSVVHSATVPVLVARELRRPDQPLRILLACDGSEVSRRAGDVLQQFTWPANTVGRVITVVQSLLAGQVPPWLEEAARQQDEDAVARAWVQHHEDQLRQVSVDMTAYCGQLPEAFRASQPIVAEGHPAEEILRVVEKEQIDLLVVGSRARSPLAGWLTGSTSERLLSAAPCSLLIVREHEQP